MIKRILFILLGLFLLVTIPIIFWLWKYSPFVDREKITTTVSVTEGSVNVYDLNESGHRVLRKVVHPGEKLVITGRSGTTKGMGLFSFNVMRPLVPLGVRALKQGMDNLNQKSKAREATRVYSEEEMNNSFVRPFGKFAAMSRANVVVEEGGFRGSGLLQVGIFDIEVSGRGMFGVDHENNNTVYLKLYEGKVWFFNLPGFMLRQFETIFGEVAARTKFPIQILDIQYREHSIFLKFRKITP